MKITVQDFTGVYDYQPFMQELRKKAANSTDIRWLDCKKIIGTDCYCDDEAIKEINTLIDNAENNTKSGIKSNTAPEIHFFDNGNYHYMSKLWTDRVQEPFSLIVFDHHPDMQPPRFGGILSCGGWVKEVLDNNKFIQNIVIIGVKDDLVETVCGELSQTGEASILDKVTFIKESELVAVTLEEAFRRPIGSMDSHLKVAMRTKATSCQVLSAIAALQFQNDMPLYISIDKDALAPAYASTNWDQGSLSTEMLKSFIASFAASHKILGIDICGERSRDFEGNELYSVHEADAINNTLNYNLVNFLQSL